MKIKRRNLNRLIESYLFESKYPYVDDQENSDAFRKWMLDNKPDEAKNARDARGRKKPITTETGSTTWGGLGPAYEKFGKDFEQDRSYFGLGSYFSDYDESKPEKKKDGSEKKQIANYNGVRPFLIENGNIGKNDTILMINGHKQKFELYKGGSVVLSGKVSTGKGGFGNKPGGNRTSTGLMQVSSIAGKGEELYTVLVGLRPTSPRIVLGPNITSPRASEGHAAEVTTRALVLSGLEEENANVQDRNIYVHGTNRERNLGSRSSGGCIRVSNDNIVKLADEHMSSGDYVYVYHSSFKSNTTSLVKASKGSTTDVVKSNLMGMGRSLYTAYEDIVNEDAPETADTLYHGEASEEEMASVLQKHGVEPNA